MPLNRNRIVQYGLALITVGALGAAKPQPPAPPAAPPTTRPAALIAFTPPTTRPTPAELETLIAKLSSDTWGERQQAQERLVQLGEEVEPRLLQLIRQTKDKEAVARAQAALRMIADNRLVGPTLVTMHLTDASPATLLHELSAQAHIEIVADPPELWTQKQWPRISVDADHQPFWALLRQICQEAGIEPEVTDGSRIHITEGGGEWVNFPAMVSGPFLMQANNITRTNSVKFSQPANVERTCDLQINGYAEPKLRVLPDSASATIEEAVDEKGNSLLPGADGTEPNLSNNSNGKLWDLEVELTYPADAGKKIAKVKGTLHFLVPTKIEVLQVDDILTAKGISRTIAGRRMTVRRAKTNPGGAYEIQVVIFRDGLNDEEWQQFSNPREFVHLLDEKSRPFLFTNSGESDAGEKQTTLSLQFETPTGPDGQRNPPGKPSKLLWDIPLESRELRVPFEFRDLTLP